MSITKFAFLPPNSTGATIHIFSFDSMLNTSPSGVYPYTTFPLVVTHQKEGAEALNCQAQLLGY